MRQLGAQLFTAFVAATLLVAGCGSSEEASLRARAHDALATGNLIEARDLLLQALDQATDDPVQATAFNDLGVVYQRLGQIEDAVVAFENSRRLDPLLPGPAYNLGILLYERGDLQRAVDLFQEAAQSDASDPRPLEYAATIEMDAERWAEAEDLLQQALTRAPHSSRIHNALGLARLHTRGASEAITHLLEAIESDPEHGASHYNLAVIHQDWLGDSDGAVEYMNAYLKTSPDDARAAAALDFIDAVRDPERTDDDPGMHVGGPTSDTHGVSLSVPDSIEGVAGEPVYSPPGTTTNTVVSVPAEVEAPEPIEVAEKPERAHSPDDPAKPPTRPRVTPRPRSVDGLLALARSQADQGDTASAYRTCREARLLAEQQGDDARAENILTATISLCHDQAGAHYDYGLSLMQQGQPEAALHSFKQAVGLAPQWVPAYLGMAETAMRTAQYDAAYIALQRALRIDPGNREATWGLAGLYDHGMKQPEEATATYREFLAHHPGDSRAAAARTRIAALQQQVLDAVESPPQTEPAPIIQATTREPDTSPAELRITQPRVRNRKAAVEAYNRGTIYQAREDWDQAIFFYTRALEQDDTFALAYYNLGKVHQTQKRTALAITAYEESIRLQPRHVNSRFNVALLYREQGDNHHAVNQLQGILRMDPNHDRSHYLLGLIYSEDRSTQQQAKTYFQRFLELSPNDRAAPAVRQWLADAP